MSNISQRSYKLLLLIVVLLNATSLCSNILEPDGALYAAIAKHIALTGDWISLYGNGADWLDKPHMPFWLAAVSFRCLGVTAFAYKLPAFLCWLAGLYYTYRLALLLYNEDVARLSVLIYGTALHAILANFDVRAEAYLTAFVIAAIYYLYLAAINRRVAANLPVGALCCALAVMTKGIFVLITIGGGLVIYQLLNRNWKSFFIHWWVVAVLTCLFILPELYALYMQFDMRPYITVFGRTHVSGIRFFFWDSQFGRFFNSGPIRGEGDLFFFLHTVLWAFLPWSLLLYPAVFQLIRRKAPFEKKQWVVAGSALISFLLFSLSKFQLPHYIVIVFPQLAMLLGGWLVSIKGESAWKKVVGVQRFLFFTGVLLLLALSLFSGIGNTAVQLLWIIAAAICFWLFFRKREAAGTIAAGTGFAALLFVFLLLLFYPSLLQYQAGMRAGQYMRDNALQGNPVMYNCNNYSFEFQAPGLVARADDAVQLRRLCHESGQLQVFMPANALPTLDTAALQWQREASFVNFHVSQLTGGFLNRKTRQAQLDSFVLIRMTAVN